MFWVFLIRVCLADEIRSKPNPGVGKVFALVLMTFICCCGVLAVLVCAAKVSKSAVLEMNNRKTQYRRWKALEEYCQDFEGKV